MTNNKKKDEMMGEDEVFGLLSEMLDEAFSTHYSEDKKPETTNDSARDHFPNLYESIQDYTDQTGKRFRMTKEQKSRNLSREQAFSEMYLGGTN